FRLVARRLEYPGEEDRVRNICSRVAGLVAAMASVQNRVPAVGCLGYSAGAFGSHHRQLRLRHFTVARVAFDHFSTLLPAASPLFGGFPVVVTGPPPPPRARLATRDLPPPPSPP